MTITKTNSLTFGILFIFIVSGMGCGVSNKKLKTLGAIIVVGIAAKLIYDMVIDYKTEQTSNENQVINKYKKTHKTLPKTPVLVAYESSIKPGDLVTAGNKISVSSSLEVVRGQNKATIVIQEKVTIFDNEDNNKELKSMVKVVNQETQKCGGFKNEFTFTLPKGMPQGVYPVTTTIIIDGKEFSPVNNKMQLVINESSENEYRFAQVD